MDNYSDAVDRLVIQVERIMQESGDPAAVDFNARRWVEAFAEREHPALGGRRPGTLMRTPEGEQVVTKLVAQMQSGAYA